MPGIEISKENLRREEKRNLILKLRFGTYETQEFKPTNHKLLVNGQAVKQKQRSKKIKKLPDYGRVKLFVSKKKQENGFGDLLSTKSAFHTNSVAGNASELEEHYYNRDGGKYNEDVYMGIQISRNGVLEAVEELQEHQNYNGLPKIISGFSSGNFTKSRKASQQFFGSYDEKYGGNITSENAPPNSFTRRISSVSGYTSSSGKFSRKASLIGRNTKRWNEASSKGKKSRRGSKPCDMEEKLLYQFHEDFNDEKNETIFFDYPGIHLSFVDVQEAIEQIVPDAFEANKVTSIQFENLNFKFGNQKKANRWHLKLHDTIIKKKLLETGIKLQRPEVREGETTKKEI